LFRQSRRPIVGLLTPLLQIAPSKTDRERVLPAVPELVSVLAEIIRRCRGSAQTLPLLSRYDPLERSVWPASLAVDVCRIGSGAT
jgi:hypothetical protein